MRLARARVLAADDGSRAWDALSETSKASGLNFEVHLWVADNPGTVCKLDGVGGIDDMARRLPAAHVRHFEGGAQPICTIIVTTHIIYCYYSVRASRTTC